MNDFYGKKFLLINGIQKGNKPKIDFLSFSVSVTQILSSL